VIFNRIGVELCRVRSRCIDLWNTDFVHLLQAHGQLPRLIELALCEKRMKHILELLPRDGISAFQL